jgi:hypothetical protein
MKRKLENSATSLETVLPATDLRSLVESGVGEMIPHIISIFLESAAEDVEKMRTAVLADDAQRLGGGTQSQGKLQ